MPLRTSSSYKWQEHRGLLRDRNSVEPILWRLRQKQKLLRLVDWWGHRLSCSPNFVHAQT